MGHGASTTCYDLDTIFIDDELLEGSKQLCENQSFRVSFVSYIKGGTWIENLRHWIPASLRTISPEERIALEKDCILYAYKLPDTLEGLYEDLLIEESEQNIAMKPTYSKESTTSMSTFCSSTNSIAITPKYKQESMNEQCIEYGGLTHNQLLSLMINIIFTQYLISYEYKTYIKYGINTYDNDEESINSRISIQSETSQQQQVEDSRYVLTKHSKIAQEIFLNCIAYVTENDLITVLQKPNWIDCFPCAIHDHTIGITIIDTSLEYNPIVYANQAFLRRAGFPCDRAVLGQNWAFLNGPKTEDDQAALIDYAIEHNQPLKAAITQYSRNGKTFVNLLALRPVGKYCIGAHFHATKGCDFETLKSVDNLLTLMSYAIKQPPCSSIESPVLSPRYEAPVSVVGVGVVGESPVLSPRYEAPVPVVGVGETVATTPYYNPSARRYSTSSNIRSNSASSEYTLSSYLHTITSQLHWKDRLTSHVSNITTAVVALCAGQRQYSSNKDNINYHNKDNLVESTTSPSAPIQMLVGRGSQEVVLESERQCLSIRLGGIEGVPEMELLDFE